MKNLQKILVKNTVLQSCATLKNINVFYEVFGQPIGNAPVVVVNHALTGNSTVSGKNGWWNNLIGENKVIDTNLYTIIAINIPGNGYDNDSYEFIENYKDYCVFDIAKLFWKTLFELQINVIFAIIGGSLGGAIAWEMAKQETNRIKHLIPIATHYVATDWVLANVFLQDKILNNSNNPIADARIHAMMLYRTPQSLTQKFSRKKQQNTQLFQVENWLVSHGQKLENRFTLSAYKLMNHLLRTIEIAHNEKELVQIFSDCTTKFHLVSVDSDAFFLANDSHETFEILRDNNFDVSHHEIKSIHGHDAFLIEYEQLNNILLPIFKKECLSNSFVLNEKQIVLS